MSNLMLKEIAYVVFLCSAFAGATPIATAEITADLSKTKINGEIIPPDGNLDPIVGYTLQTISDELYQFPEYFPSGETELSFTLADNSIFARSDKGSSLCRSTATGDDEYNYATSNVGSYAVFKVEDVSDISFSLDFNATMSLMSGTAGEDANGSWTEYLDLFIIDDEDNNLIPLTGNQNSVFYSMSEGNAESFNETHTLDIRYDFLSNFGENFTGKLALQSTLISEADVQVVPSAPVPEPAVICLLLVGIPMLAGMRIRRKIIP